METYKKLMWNLQKLLSNKTRVQGLLLVVCSLCGLLFLYYYINSAGYNVVYTDYIRITNLYLSLDHIPTLSQMWLSSTGQRSLGYFPFLFINVYFFDFNTMFDMTLGILSIFLSSLVIIKYYLKNDLGFANCFLVLILIYSLNKWELLLNGTGWAALFAFALMYYNFLIFDDVFIKQNNSPFNMLLMCLLPIVIIFGFAGGYSIAYVLASILVLALCMINGYIVNGKINKCIILPASVLVGSIILYLWDMPINQAVIGGNSSFFELLSHNFSYIVSFTLASFASTIIGQETFFAGGYPESLLIVLGLLVILCYIFSIYLYLKNKLYQKTFFPMFMILFAIITHLIILYSRSGFNTISYGMSSRYEPAFLFGIIGVFCIFAYSLKETHPNYKKINPLKFLQCQKTRKSAINIVMVIFMSVFIIGTVVTTLDEVHKIPYRFDAYNNMETIALKYHVTSDQDLSTLQTPGDQVRNALQILEKKKLNIFSNSSLNNVFSKSPDGLIRSSGWYADNWVSHQGYAVFNANSESNISFEGFVPGFLPNNHVVVQLNDKVIFAGNLTGGTSISFTGQVQKGINMVNVTCEKEVTPASLKINGDLRPLAFHLLINRT